ncbi:MAG: alkaline phosphatase family protein [Acidobacteria bacterium]|nr:alkaline phosphatase family protein [Acidobacteriota bacterium]
MAAGGLAAAGAGTSANRPKLLVLVVLEQLRPDLLEAISPVLIAGGLRRVLSRGVQFPDCRNLASTFPASSLATLATGAWPAQHGIVADAWYDRTSKAPVRASSEMLLASTFSAEAARAKAHTRAYVVALDSWQAGLFAAEPGVRQFWLSPHGVFATLGDPPDWLREFNATNPIENRRNAKWSSPSARPGAPALRTLTYNPDHPSEFMDLYRASPFSQETQISLAAKLIEEERLGTGDTLDLVTIVAGSSALLGYEVGADDPLLREMALSLDREMRFLLERLDAAVGEGGFNLVLAGAHGAPPAPPAAARARMAVNGESVAAAVDKALQAGGLGRVARYLYPFLYLDHPAAKDARAVREAAARAALEHPAVAGFYTADGDCSVRDGWIERYRNSFHPRRSGDVMLSYRAEYVEDYGQGRGISYGSLYNYDARVPLCFYGPWFRTGVIDRPVQLVDVAATLARLMGVAAPSSSVGRVLSEALAE